MKLKNKLWFAQDLQSTIALNPLLMSILMGVGVLTFYSNPSGHDKRYFVKTQLPKIIAPLHFYPLQCVV